MRVLTFATTLHADARTRHEVRYYKKTQTMEIAHISITASGQQSTKRQLFRDFVAEGNVELLAFLEDAMMNEILQRRGSFEWIKRDPLAIAGGGNDRIELSEPERKKSNPRPRVSVWRRLASQLGPRAKFATGR